jgi:hypothetical protein
MPEVGPIALVPLAIVASGIVCFRLPAFGVVLAFLLTAIYGSIEAFTGFSAAPLVDLLLAGLWTGLLIERLARGQVQRQLIWPAFLLLGIYLVLTLAAVLMAPDTYPAFLSFRLSGWYLLAVILIAYAGWDATVRTRIARGLALVGLLIGGYATFRWLAGPAPAETARALEVAGGFNVIDGELRTFGSFNSGHQLGFWAAAVAPFCLAATLGWTGRWRLVSGLAFVLLTVGVLASGIRGGFVGLVLASGLVLALMQFARSTTGVHVGRNALVGATAVAIIGGALLFTAGATDRLDRYTNIFTPEEDRAYVNRTAKWGEAVDEIQQHPFGQGLGSASLNPAIRDPYLSSATLALDNSYLKVAWEQGIAVAIVFVAGLVLVLIRLAAGGVRSREREVAAMGAGGAGALAATMIVFFFDLAIEDVAALGPWMVIGLGASFVIADRASVPAARRTVVQHPVYAPPESATNAQKAGFGAPSMGPPRRSA